MRPTVSQLLRDHVTLSIASVDRLYLVGYCPKLMTPGQVFGFLRDHLGYPVVSPVLFDRLRKRFVGEIDTYVASSNIPMIEFERGKRKDDIAKERRAEFHGTDGVVFVGTAQERAMSFRGVKRSGPLVHFDFAMRSVFVNHYYFYVEDPDWGPAFVKVGSYLPYPVRLCVNGHEWAKRRLVEEGIAFESLDNGFLSCERPDRVQELCDDLGPEHVLRFFHRWSRRLPWPFTPHDRDCGYTHQISIRQAEMSLTQVFDRPVQGRHFFEEVIRENLDLGRPDRVSLLFPHTRWRRASPPTFGYRTRVITDGVNPSLHVEYKSSHVKQYFKEERALRTETTINDAHDVRVGKLVANLPKLKEVGQTINQKLLESERISEDCVLSEDAFDSLQHATTTTDGQRAAPLRFGDTRVLALLHALCMFLHLPLGFRNRDIRGYVANLLGIAVSTYTCGKMTYDLRRLRRKGLIERIPGTSRYRITPLGLRVAYFYSRLHLRILRPAWASLGPPPDELPRRLRTAFDRVDVEIERIIDAAALRTAA